MRYDWRCTKCSEEVIVDRKMLNSAEPPTKEESSTGDCDHEWVRVLRTAGFSLQGSGWFKDGYDGMGNMKSKS